MTITVLPATLPNGIVGSPYTATLSAIGGTAPYTFAITSGLLPAPLVLSDAGLLAGVPSMAGTYSFTVTATDANSNTGSQSYTLTIGAAGTLFLTISNVPPPASASGKLRLPGLGAGSVVQVAGSMDGSAPAPAGLGVYGDGSFTVPAGPLWARLFDSVTATWGPWKWQAVAAAAQGSSV